MWTSPPSTGRSRRLRHAPSDAARSSTHTAHRRHPSSGATEPPMQPEHHQAATQDPRLSTVPPADDAASSTRPRAQRARRHHPPRSRHPVPPTRKGARTPTRIGSPPATSWPIGPSSLATFSCPRSACVTPPPWTANRPQLGRPLLTSDAPGPAGTHARDVRSPRSTLPAGSDERRHPARGPHPPRPWSPAAVREVRPDRPAHGTHTGCPLVTPTFHVKRTRTSPGCRLARSQPHRGVR